MCDFQRASKAVFTQNASDAICTSNLHMKSKQTSIMTQIQDGQHKLHDTSTQILQKEKFTISTVLPKVQNVKLFF